MESKPIDQGWGVIWVLPNGKLHREGGPAIEYRGGAYHWFINGQRHRLDGPAIKYDEGISGWWINGYHVDYEITKWAKEFNIDLKNLTDEDKQMIALYWSGYGK